MAKSKNDQFPVTNKIPLPAQKAKYPFEKMKVGDSFFAPGIASKHASQAAAYWAKKLGRKFVSRAVGDGTRIWRSK